MTTKIISLRLPRTTYDNLAKAAAISGLPLAVYVRSKIEQADLAASLDQLVAEVKSAAAISTPVAPSQPSREREILLLARSIASQLNPGIPQAVRAKLRAESEARK